jgi:hypothetical protein
MKEQVARQGPASVCRSPSATSVHVEIFPDLLKDVFPAVHPLLAINPNTH